MYLSLFELNGLKVGYCPAQVVNFLRTEGCTMRLSNWVSRLSCAKYPPNLKNVLEEKTPLGVLLITSLTTNQLCSKQVTLLGWDSEYSYTHIRKPLCCLIAITQVLEMQMEWKSLVNRQREIISPEWSSNIQEMSPENDIHILLPICNSEYCIFMNTTSKLKNIYKPSCTDEFIECIYKNCMYLQNIHSQTI